MTIAFLFRCDRLLSKSSTSIVDGLAEFASLAEDETLDGQRREDIEGAVAYVFSKLRVNNCCRVEACLDIRQSINLPLEVKG